MAWGTPHAVSLHHQRDNHRPYLMSPTHLPRQVVVDLTNFPVTNGQYKILMRIRGIDKDIVDAANRALGLTQADFCRVMVINGAREVLRQLGIPEPSQIMKAQPNESAEPIE